MTRAVFAATVVHIAGKVMVGKGKLNQVQNTQQWHKNFASRFATEESAIRKSGNAPNYLPRLIIMEILIYVTLKKKHKNPNKPVAN